MKPKKHHHGARAADRFLALEQIMLREPRNNLAIREHMAAQKVSRGVARYDMGVVRRWWRMRGAVGASHAELIGEHLARLEECYVLAMTRSRRTYDMERREYVESPEPDYRAGAALAQRIFELRGGVVGAAPEQAGRIIDVTAQEASRRLRLVPRIEEG